MGFMYYLANVTVFFSALFLLFAAAEKTVDLIDNYIRKQNRVEQVVPVKTKKKAESHFYNFIIE